MNITVYLGANEGNDPALKTAVAELGKWIGESGNTLTYSKEIHGMWEMGHYIDLLMGEIPRLTDDENGYGPRGKDFIAHVDVPENVRQAFEELQGALGNKVREANPLYASK